MSFFLQVDVDGLTTRQGHAIEAACRQRGAWPVWCRPPVRRRTLFGPRIRPLELYLPDADGGRDLLTDDAEWDAPSWAMEPDLLPRLAATIHVLDEHLPQGFAFRATWVGSTMRHERQVTVEELADLVLGSQLNEFTRYRVPPQEPTGPGTPVGGQT